ncbi:hypothetical protein [Paracoccus nototheniae]|uniref:Uncharacterized protein n=1 Tax=Paracoccus nototheniae TaxID=2489002 RepID=A0ABW4DY21_9RHOB|nr:hypothetical protein [Paracoccus nototheniae]
MTIAAEANFTVDMAQNLVTMFEHLGKGEEVTVKLSNKGVWAVTPQGVRMFIGSTEVFEVGSNGSDATTAQI